MLVKIFRCQKVSKLLTVKKKQMQAVKDDYVDVGSPTNLVFFLAMWIKTAQKCEWAKDS